jgi:hypothetical protein
VLKVGARRSRDPTAAFVRCKARIADGARRCDSRLAGKKDLTHFAERLAHHEQSLIAAPKLLVGVQRSMPYTLPSGSMSRFSSSLMRMVSTSPIGRRAPYAGMARPARHRPPRRDGPSAEGFGPQAGAAG